MMDQMVTGNDLQQVGLQFDNKIKDVATKVEAFNDSMGIMEQKPSKRNERVGDFEKQMTELRRDFGNLKQRHRMTAPRRPPRRGTSATSSSSGTSSTTISPLERMPRVNTISRMVSLRRRRRVPDQQVRRRETPGGHHRLDPRPRARRKDSMDNTIYAKQQNTQSSAETTPKRSTALKEFNKQHGENCKLNPGCIMETCQRGL